MMRSSAIAGAEPAGPASLAPWSDVGTSDIQDFPLFRLTTRAAWRSRATRSRHLYSANAFCREVDHLCGLVLGDQVRAGGHVAARHQAGPGIEGEECHG